MIYTFVPKIKATQTKKAGPVLQRAAASMVREIPLAFEFVMGRGKRSAADNAMIAEVQAGMDRNAWFVSPETLSKAAKLASRLATLDRGKVRALVEQMKDTLAAGVTQNVARQRNPDGSTFRPLTPGYLRWKRSKGFKGPILVATGELIRTMRVVVVKRR